jgi:hypothetical protein
MSNFETSAMEPLVIESGEGDSVVSPLTPGQNFSSHASHSPERSPRDSEDDGMMEEEEYEKSSRNGDKHAYKKWYLPAGLILIILAIAAIVTGAILSNPYGDDCCVLDDIPSGECVTSFGMILGSDAMGVIGYSNCNEDTVSEIPNFVPLGEGEVYAGMKWQCVEYSRRWLILSKQVTYDSIDYAYQIWDLSDVTNVTDSDTKYPFLSFPSGQSLTPPEVGCLLIYNSTDYLEPTGHVSVVVGVQDNVILLGEQNWSNDIWLGSDYARNLTVVLSDGKYAVDDQYLIGWKCVDESRR